MINKLLIGTLLVPTMLSTALAESSSSVQFALKTPTASKSILLAIHQNQNNLISVGEHGIILNRSADNAWIQDDVPTNITLTSITELVNGTLIAVGHEGTILRKLAGEQWTIVFDGYQLITLKQERLKDSIEALKNVIDNETDEDEIDELSMQLEDLEYAQEDFEGEIESGPTSPLLDVKAIDENRIIAVGAYNSLLLSEDSGDNWTLINDRIDNQDNFHLNNIVKSDNTLFIFGEAGVVYRSKDNGQTFELLYLPYEGTFFGGEVHGDFVVAYGLKGNLALSNDGGESWEHVQIDTKTTLLGSALDKKGNAWLVGHAGVVVKVSAKDFSMQNFKHPSGDIFTDVVVNNKDLTLVGQNGAVQWQAGL